MKKFQYIFNLFVIVAFIFTFIWNNGISQRVTRAEQKIDRLDSIMTQWMHESKIRRLTSDSVMKAWKIDQVRQDSAWRAYYKRQKNKEY